MLLNKALIISALLFQALSLAELSACALQQAAQ
jgi:hypothetical protein